MLGAPEEAPVADVVAEQIYSPAPSLTTSPGLYTPVAHSKGLPVVAVVATILPAPEPAGGSIMSVAVVRTPVCALADTDMVRFWLSVGTEAELSPVKLVMGATSKFQYDGFSVLGAPEPVPVAEVVAEQI